MFSSVKTRDLLLEMIGSIVMLVSLILIYLDALQFQSSPLLFTGDIIYGNMETDYTRQTLFFRFWICGNNCYYAGYNAPLGFYLTLISIFALTIFRSSSLKILISTIYIIHLNVISYLLYFAYQSTTFDFTIVIVINLVLMFIALAVYLPKSEVPVDSKDISPTSNTSLKLYLPIIGSGLIVIAYMWLLHIHPVFQSDQIGYTSIILSTLITLPSFDQKLRYVIAITALSLSLVTWWVSIFGLIVVGFMLSLAYEQLLKREITLRLLSVFILLFPVVGIFYVLSLIRSFRMGW